MDRPTPASAIWALGVTQIIGYGTLFYSFSVLAPVVGASVGWSPEWMFGALSIGLLAGGLIAPLIGRLIDKAGAARTMTVGSAAAGVSLAAAAAAPNGVAFAAALIAMEIAAAAALYSAAFAALVQLRHESAGRSITHLTLIAGFASTLFWPLTSALLTVLSWQQVYLVFALTNLLVCVPLHWWLARLTTARGAEAARAPALPQVVSGSGVLAATLRTPALVLLLVGFAIEGFILSAILMHIIPLLGALGLVSAGLLITTLFGPAQVLSRVTNMLLGSGLRQTHLGVIAAALPTLGVLVLVVTAPSPIGGVAFAVLFGLGSGLISIVSGSLPLELFGREKYGSRLGLLSSARQVATALAPFALALMMAAFNVSVALWVVVLLGLAAVAVFGTVAALPRRAAPEPAALPRTA